MGNRRKLSDAQLRQIRELLSAGMSLRQIAKQIGVSAQTIANHAKAVKSATENTDNNGRYTEGELRALWRYCRGQTDAPEIVAGLGCMTEDEARALIRQWEG